MANLKEVRTRIASVKSTQQITSAMKMVAASKLRKAQTSILKLRPFAEQQNLLLQELIAATSGDIESPFAKKPAEESEEKILYVAFTSNRGLCGAFNTNVIKKTNTLLAEHQANETVDTIGLMTIGRKATEFYTKQGVKIIGSYDHLYDNLKHSNAASVAQELIDLYLSGEYTHVVFIYHKFINAVVQKIQVELFLPIEAPEKGEDKDISEPDFIFDPSEEEILQDLIPQILKTQFYKVLLDSWASELGARMTAMSQATDNASEMLKQLRLSYNKARQAAITKEILEIVGGAEALSNK